MHTDGDLQRPRIIASIAATVIALSCGTNYVYSAWAPQFAERLRLSSTESNLIGLFGNLGMYSMGVPIGLFVDNQGPRPAVLAGSAILAIGYFPLHEAYDSASGSVPLLCFFSYLSGLGGCMAFAAAVKTSALNWPHHRGTATAFPLAAFGLSAFFFSLLGSILFPGDPSDFLMLLAVGTCGLTFVGFFFLKVHSDSHSHYSPVPDPVGQEQELEHGYDHERDHGEEHSASSSRPFHRASPTGAKGRHNNTDLEPGTSSNNSLAMPKTPFAETAATSSDDDIMDETSSLVSIVSETHAVGKSTSVDIDGSHRVDIRGLDLLRSQDFWHLFFIMAILAGIGLMTINNIGNNAKALWEKYDANVGQDFLVLRQQMHVSVLSVCSFLGRLGSGVGSDWLATKLHASRVWCLVLATIIFFVAQICALLIENPHLLIFVSGLSGLGYGFLFGVFPSIVAESFGIRGLSQNWGFMTLAPVVSSNIFNIFYGRTYDQHSIKKPGGERVCMDGIECYKAAYWVTISSCGLGLILSLWVIRRQHLRQMNETSKGELED